MLLLWELLITAFVLAEQGSGLALTSPEKPGECPELSDEAKEQCTSSCVIDYDCPDNQKCCSNGCSTVCKEPVKVDRCVLKPVVGPCRASIPKWYYDSETNSCELYSWGGCGPDNVNRFDSERDCKDACHPCDSDPQCPLSAGENTCQAYWFCWYYDTASGQCKSKGFSGCGTCGKNCYASKQECNDMCLIGAKEICSLPKDPGPCKASKPRWFYDEKKGKCIEFTYGGCQGNANRFMSEADCNEMCHPCSGKAPEPCDAEDRPACSGFWQPWYYDGKSKECKMTDGFNVCVEICSKNVYSSGEECKKKCRMSSRQ